MSMKVHSLCARFMSHHCSIFGDNWRAVTNHMHAVGSGHLAHFLEKCKNLSRFQQQGWEALNALLQHACHNNTNKGGSEGTNKEKETDVGKHAKALARLCMRRNLWPFGVGQEFFNRSCVDGTDVDPTDCCDSDDDNRSAGDEESAASNVDVDVEDGGDDDGSVLDEPAGAPGAVDKESPVLEWWEAGVTNWSPVGDHSPAHLLHVQLSG